MFLVLRLLALSLFLITTSSVASADGRRTLHGLLLCQACWSDEERQATDCKDRCQGSDSTPILVAARDTTARSRILTGDPFAGDAWLEDIGERVQVTGIERKNEGGLEVLFYERAEPVRPELDPEGKPKLSLYDTLGNRRNLLDLRGHVVVLNFWATWCGPCRTEMPILSKVDASYDAGRVRFIGAAADGSHRLAWIEQVKEKGHIEFPIWTGANASDMRAFGVGPAIPATVILDGDGRVTWRKQGVVREKELRHQIDAALKRMQ